MIQLTHWHTKLAAWTHDPAEKALVLLRDPAGHEGGTVAVLQEQIFSGAIPDAIESIVKTADHWASAADRPNYPRDKSGRYQPWTQVQFTKEPMLVHPLSGNRYDLEPLTDISAEEIKDISQKHFNELIQYNNAGDVDPKKTALAFWRFGPHLQDPNLKHLWQLLPADTRVPDHTIWSHLDLTSAFASAMSISDDDQPALLTMSFGPVQDFIAQARSTSDLWAGSHLLSRMVWEAMTVLCEEIGPDSLIFPQLRGVALVDIWLQESMGLSKSLFQDQDWRENRTDSNPLFSAALPNKFTALVPASRMRELAEAASQRAREWVISEAEEMLRDLLSSANIEDSASLPCWKQLRDQLSGFPEVHWAGVPWTLVQRGEKDRANSDQSELKQVLASFIPAGESYLDSSAWRLLSKELQVEGADFYQPNPGLLYPALYELLDRVSAAAKVARPFDQHHQEGYRCTLTGEQEWLTTDRSQLKLSPKKRQNEATLWNVLVSTKERPFGIKKGEHLCAIAMIKRLWPKRFSEYVANILKNDSEGPKQSVSRFIVSTHTFAIASMLERLVDNESFNSALAIQAEEAASTVLPRKLVKTLSSNKRMLKVAKGLPTLMELARDEEDVELSRVLKTELKALNQNREPETYFAMLYMDGDNMGAWIADSWENNERGNQNRLTYEQTWHKQIRAGLETRFANVDQPLKDYLQSYRPVTPARHMAISSALNSFALQIARYVVEECYMGKLLYAGGDDVMAMISVKDLLPCMFTLRLAYSGVFPVDQINPLLNLGQMKIGGGHVAISSKNNRDLYRVMGHKATASIGAVIAHQTAPLNAVLRQLRQAESDAKAVIRGDGSNRDAFALRILKRAGGAERVSLPWLLDQQSWLDMPALEDTSIGRLVALRDQLGQQGNISRRAAYIVNTWLAELPDEQQFTSNEAFKEMIEVTLSAQLKRQGAVSDLAPNLVQLASIGQPGTIKKQLRDIFASVEFLSRSGRI